MPRPQWPFLTDLTLWFRTGWTLPFGGSSWSVPQVGAVAESLFAVVAVGRERPGPDGAASGPMVVPAVGA
jgi:hypothetical protein